MGPLKLMSDTVPSLILFAVASAMGITLLVARFLVTGHLTYFYLPWNLFLAWFPLAFALLARQVAPPHHCHGRSGWTLLSIRRWFTALCGLGWLLFFPNAPYILTDLMHLAGRPPASMAPLWFDLLLHLTVAMTGLLLGFASLAIMQNLVCGAHGRLAGWSFAVAALALSGFGIYLGRFLRWNSWDVVGPPLSLLADIGERLAQPWRYPRACGFSVLCFLFLFVSYLMCVGLPRLFCQDPAPRIPVTAPGRPGNSQG